MTTADAIRGLVEAATKAMGPSTGPCWGCQASAGYTGDRVHENCPAQLLYAALAAWREREPLRDDEPVRDVLSDCKYSGLGIFQGADAIDAALFGERAPTKRKDGEE